MGQVLHWGLLLGQEPVGVETSVHNRLVEVGGFFEDDKGGFGKEVLGRGIRGEDVETFPKDPFETVKARIRREVC